MPQDSSHKIPFTTEVDGWRESAPSARSAAADPTWSRSRGEVPPSARDRQYCVLKEASCQELLQKIVIRNQRTAKTSILSQHCCAFYAILFHLLFFWFLLALVRFERNGIQ